ncbi:hypothetical protein DL96DRAFT_1702689 [Flagelloscypha sp. PMI_526]|nr:hypothetical protein DL96DRAFT_1702689 [Flagelloscypha sp. PMI_526]
MADMDIDSNSHISFPLPSGASFPVPSGPNDIGNLPSSVTANSTSEGHQTDSIFSSVAPPLQASVPARDSLRDGMQVKVHHRKAEKDNWTYIGRGYVSQDIHGQSSKVVVRSATTNKLWITFNESSEVVAERRGNFVVIGVVKGQRVESWSLNASTSGDTLKLLASIELAAYKSKDATSDPRSHAKARRRVERVIKEDRRRRHKRRKETESMFDAFASTTIGDQGGPEVPDDMIHDEEL